MLKRSRASAVHVRHRAGLGLRTLTATLVCTVVATVGMVALAGPASAYPSPTASFEGHGWGYGQGMGQWGALGYALGGTGYASILDHFYGGTSLSRLSSGQESTDVRVALTENDGHSVIVTSGSPFSLAGTSISAAGGQAIFMNPSGSGWEVFVGSGCGGPWTLRATLSNPTAVPSSNPGLGAPDTASAALQLCQIGGNLTVRGSIEATYNSNAAARTVNILPLEQYVAGVVPNESPAGWGTLGTAGPAGPTLGIPRTGGPVGGRPLLRDGQSGVLRGVRRHLRPQLPDLPGNAQRERHHRPGGDRHRRAGHGVSRGSGGHHPVLLLHRWLHRARHLSGRGRHR